MTNENGPKTTQPSSFALDTLLIILVLFVGISSVATGFLGPSPAILIGGIVIIAVGVFWASRVRAKHLPK
ncbi:MAG: hypothetical protein HYR94_24925 [Chloroflexi bacterium]|nr:hypothetical protein [Chloroflexota bacterium]